jgi:hypothetical protein
MPQWQRDRAVTIEPARLALMDLVTNAYQQAAGIETPASGFSTNISIKAVATMPELSSTDILALVQVFGSFLYPVALTLQVPLFVFVRVLEKEAGLLELQKAMGMLEWQYTLVDVGLNLGMYVVVVAFFWAMGLAMQFAIFTQTSPVLMVLVLGGWGFSLVTLSMLIAAFVNSRRVATVAGFVIALFGSLMGVLFADGVYGDNPNFPTSMQMPHGINAFPIFALCRALYLLNFRCVGFNECYTSASELGMAGSELTTVILYLWVDGLVLLFVAMYLDRILPKTYGVPAHACFCIPALSRRCPGGILPCIRHSVTGRACARPASNDKDSEDGDGLSASLLAREVDPDADAMSEVFLEQAEGGGSGGGSFAAS